MNKVAQSKVHPSIEVLICTHNRSSLLKNALIHLNQAQRPRGIGVSIFVAANNCTDATVHLLHLYNRFANVRDLLPLRFIEVPAPGKSNALNASIPELSGDYIACVDDDHRIDTNYFLEIVNAFDKHVDATIFCGKILPDWDGTEPSWVHDSGQYRIYPLPVPKFDHGEAGFVVGKDTVTPGGGNLVVKRHALVRVGRFDNTLGPVGHDLGGAEDIDWVKRALNGGEILRYIPKIVQYHYVDGSRLTTTYVVRKAYGRTLSTMKVRSDISPQDRFPMYMLRKFIEYAAHLLAPNSADVRRYYLVRSTAALAEIIGFMQTRRILRRKQ